MYRKSTNGNCKYIAGIKPIRQESHGGKSNANISLPEHLRKEWKVEEFEEDIPDFKRTLKFAKNLEAPSRHTYNSKATPKKSSMRSSKQSSRNNRKVSSNRCKLKDEIAMLRSSSRRAS